MNLILLGSMGIAIECLEWLLTRPDFRIAGVVCSREPMSAWRKTIQDRNMLEVAEERGIPILDMDDLQHVQADIGVSVRFHKVLRRSHLNRFKLGVINLHGAPLPEMRGSMCDAAAIMEGRKEYGTSLHWMNERVDAGDIIDVKRFPIEPQHTVYDLFESCNRIGLELMKQYLPQIAAGKAVSTPQDIMAAEMGITPQTYKVEDVKACKEIKLGTRSDQIWNVARAFQFPGHEPAYIRSGSGKIYVSIQG
ncbi:formyl transferase [Paenibacillus sp. ACRRX]|uniref:methionyl-tRNA formyltransferase n=1 Tax=unclassified Paenibacillus TaxID=185978 RepID=UPI001EF5B36C|nr:MULTISPECIES: formyltransferase family protein [unclassified Paenibacillus]MCG7408986.1 formyl transferase [Paenibacillus sp. ACRRX]MDK8182015.1 formyltransferase family protein [Paenibacillus sp. UMB4589-SE434]